MWGIVVIYLNEWLISQFYICGLRGLSKLFVYSFVTWWSAVTAGKLTDLRDTLTA